MAERGTAAKGRRMGSSRRKQLRDSFNEAPAAAPDPGEEMPWASEIVQRVQDLFRERDKDQAGFVTRSDMQKLQEEDFPCSVEELELIFDGLDAAGTGRLSTEEFTAGLRQFLSSQKATRDHRRRKTASRRVRLVLPSQTLEGADSEEQRRFATFMEQLGTDNVSGEQEVWQLWGKLRQDEPQLLSNPDDFLAELRHRIQEARSKKEALEAALSKRVAEHDKEVQQLCEALEQQIQEGKQRLEQESVSRGQQHGWELRQALDASEREVQRLGTAQKELETRCHGLRSTQQAASTENRQLEESNRVLEDQLQLLRRQLQQTHERLQTARAAVARERAEEPGDRAVVELPSAMPVSPQMSPEKSEKHPPEMRIRLGPQSGEPKAKSTHQVVWEVLPAELSLVRAPPRASPVEEDPFPEFLKEQHFSDKSSLLREMNAAIFALSKQLKPQAPGAPPTPADTAHRPQDDAEPQMGLEAAAAHGTTPRVLRETLPSLPGHKLFEGDPKERSAAAELRAPGVTQAGASVGAGHPRAQELGAEQGESPEEARRMLLLQGKGAGVKEPMLKAAEHMQGALGESTEAGEKVLMEVEGEGWMQEKTDWEKAQPPGETEEAALCQGENLEAGLRPPEAGEAGLTAGWQLGTAGLSPALAAGDHAQPQDVGQGEEADPPSWVSKKLEIKPGERLEPNPPLWGDGASQGDRVLPEVTVAPGPGMLEEERVGAEVQPLGESSDADVPPAPAQHGGSSGAGAEEGQVEVTQPRGTEPQPQGESARGDTAWGGSVGAEGPLPAAGPPADVREGGAGPDVQPLEAQSSDANAQLLAEVVAALQPPSDADPSGTEQGGSVAPGVQPLEESDKPEFGLGEEMGAAAVHGEGPSLAESPAGRSPDQCELFPVETRALELVETEDAWIDRQLRGGASPEPTQEGEGGAAVRLVDEAEDGAQGQGEHGLLHKPVLDPQGAGLGQGEGAGAGVQPREEAESLDTLAAQSADGNVQLMAEVDELKQIPGGSMDADLQPLSEAGSLGTEQGWSVAPDVQPLEQADKPELVEMEAEDAQADTQLRGGASPQPPPGRHAAAKQLGEEAEDGAQGQGERGLTREPVCHPHGVAIRQGEGPGADARPRDEVVLLDVAKDQSTGVNAQLMAEVDELKQIPGGSMDADLQPLSEAGSLGTEQGWSLAPDLQPLDEVDKTGFVEMMETEDSWIDLQLHGGASPETPKGEEPLGESSDADVPPAPAQHGGSSGAGAEEGQVEVTQPRGTEPQPQGESARGDTAWGGSVGAEGPLPAAGPPADVREGGAGPDVQPLEAQSSDANAQLLAEVVAALQPPSDADPSGTEQGGSVAPGVQPLEESDKPEFGLGEEMGAAAVHGEGPSLAESPAGRSPDQCELFPVETRALELVETEDAWIDRQLRGGASPEPTQEGEGGAAVRLVDEAEDGAQGQGEHELPHEPVLDPQGAGLGQGEGAGAGVQPREEAESLDTLAAQSADGNVQLMAEVDELKQIPGGSMDADLQPLSEAGSLGTEQGWSVAPDVQPLEQADKPELVEMEAEDAQADTQLRGGASPQPPPGRHAAAKQLGEEAEDGAQGQGECGLTHEPVCHPHGVAIRQGEGPGADARPRDEVVLLDVAKDQSTGVNAQLMAEVDELKQIPGGSMDADLQPLSEAGSLGTEQGWSLAPDLQPLDEVDKTGFVEMMETEDSWIDLQLHGGASPETPQGRRDSAATHFMDEAEDGAQGQGEHGLLHEPVLDPQGAGLGQGEGAGAGVQPREEAESLDTLAAQSADANVQLMAEVDELKQIPGGSMDADLQPLSEAGSLGTEQGWSLAPDLQPLDEVDKTGFVEMMETEDSWIDLQLHGGASPETPKGEEPLGESSDADVPPAPAQHGGSSGAGAEEGQVEVTQPRGTEPQPQGESARGDTAWGGSVGAEGPLPAAGPPADVREGGAGPDVQPLEAQSSDANAQLLAEVVAALQPPSDADPSGTEQGGSVAPGVQPLEESDKPEFGLGEEMGAAAVHGEGPSLAESPAGRSPDQCELFPVETRALELVETEDAWIDRQLRGGASPEPTQEGEGGAAVRLVDEAEDGAQGQGEHGLLHKPVLDPQGAGLGQGEGAGAGVQPREEAESLDTLAAQSADANVQLMAEVDELKQIPGGSMDADLQPLSEAGSLGTEQGWSVAPDVQPLEQVDKPELVEMMETEDSWIDLQLCGGTNSQSPQGGRRPAAKQLGEEAEDGAQGQGEHELPHEPVLDPQGAGLGQGEGAGAGVQPREEAESLDTLAAQSADGNVQLMAEVDELKQIPGGSTAADLAPLGAAGMQEGEQSQTPGSETGLCAAAGVWEGAAAALVSPTAAAALYPERAAAAEGPGLEAKLAAVTGPDWQILEDTQTLGLLQGERAAAERRPLDGAQGLEEVQGERQEAGMGSLVKTQDLGLKQEHNDGASALASPVSEVPLRISTLKLEMMMQEDVLVPDVWRLGTSGQASQSKLQEQVSAQADKVRLHTASQQPEEKPAHVMETERVAAGPAEPPKQEMPPVSTLNTRVQQEEDAGNHQPGVVLRGSSLGDAANSSMQPQRQLLGEQSKDLNVGQQRKKQEVGQKMSQEGKPGPGEPRAVTADGAGAAPKGSPEASLDPDHLYNVLFVGDSHVGKTSFLYRLQADTFNPHLTATVGLDYQVKNLVVDNERFALRLWDSAGQERYHSITKQFFRKADGVVLMYDITSEYSFSDVRYWLSCIQEGAEEGVTILLLGNKTDCAAERQVPTEEGERLAKEHQLMFFECSAASGHNVSESMVSLIRLLKVHEDELKKKAEEVSKPPQKKKGCCW